MALPNLGAGWENISYKESPNSIQQGGKGALIPRMILNKYCFQICLPWRKNWNTCKNNFGCCTSGIMKFDDDGDDGDGDGDDNGGDDASDDGNPHLCWGASRGVSTHGLASPYFVAVATLETWAGGFYDNVKASLLIFRTSRCKAWNLSLLLFQDEFKILHPGNLTSTSSLVPTGFVHLMHELHELQFFKLAEMGRQRMLVEFYLIYVDVEETVLKMYQMAEIRCNSFTDISDTGASQAGTSDTNTSDIGTSHWRIFQFSDLPLCCYCCGTKSKTVGGKVSNIFSEHFVSKRFVSKHSSRTLSKFSCITSIKRF